MYTWYFKKVYALGIKLMSLGMYGEQFYVLSHLISQSKRLIKK